MTSLCQQLVYRLSIDAHCVHKQEQTSKLNCKRSSVVDFLDLFTECNKPFYVGCCVLFMQCQRRKRNMVMSARETKDLKLK